MASDVSFRQAFPVIEKSNQIKRSFSSKACIYKAPVLW